jgi:hypothetical protein
MPSDRTRQEGRRVTVCVAYAWYSNPEGCVDSVHEHRVVSGESFDPA